jgi:16S rRNA (guanine(966)-N(2))-methyltransferase RsmD
MRVIAGSLKGCRLKAPAWDGLRPTSDKLRETLFNILAPRVSGARVLDGYAGTGAVGIEALSRGAAAATFIERDRRAAALMAENLARCGITNGCAIIRASVARALSDLRAAGALFDIAVLDPPYDQEPDAEVAMLGALVAPGGVVVIEHARRRAPAVAIGPLVRTRQVVSGDSALSFYACPP